MNRAERLWFPIFLCQQATEVFSFEARKNNNNRNNKRNVIGLVSIVLWALFFTILLRSCQSAYENADTVQVPYTTFKEWLVEDKIKEVNVETSQYTFTLREGVTVELPKEESSQSESWMNSSFPLPRSRRM